MCAIYEYQISSVQLVKCLPSNICQDFTHTVLVFGQEFPGLETHALHKEEGCVLQPCRSRFVVAMWFSKVLQGLVSLLEGAFDVIPLLGARAILQDDDPVIARSFAAPVSLRPLVQCTSSWSTSGLC